MDVCNKCIFSLQLRNLLFSKVLLYDPLFSWTLSPEKAMALQRKAEADVSVSDGGDILDALDGGGEQTNDMEEAAEVNKMAERALLRLRQKLEGVEEGVHLSVSGQVSEKRFK